MGILKKMFGIQGAKIGITVDKPYYISGEIVTGRIYLQVMQPFRCEAIMIKARGKEFARWTESKTRQNSEGKTETYTEHHHYSKEFFKEDLVICNIAQTIATGYYSYPFVYQLPAGIPGTFRMPHNASGEGQISYKLKATVKVEGFFAKDVEAKVDLAVYEQVLSMIQGGTASKVKTVRFCCCFNKGNCELHVRMDKNVYVAGETSQLIVNVNNQSTVDVRSMKARLVRKIVLSSGMHKHVSTTTEMTQSFRGVAALSSIVDQYQPLPLVGPGICPSTNGRHVSCTYTVEVSCDLPWCPDVTLRMPVSIVAPMIVYATAVPEWVPSDSSVALPSIGQQFAVHPDVTSSENPPATTRLEQ